jgi:hypothetical protein
MATDPDGDDLVFSISGHPHWAHFDDSNGALSGTPGPGDEGTTVGVVIKAADAVAAVTLPPFNIVVDCRTVEVPDVTATREAAAVIAVTDAGFTPEISYQVTGEPKGTVMSQTPGGGEPACAQSSVRLIVSFNNRPIAIAGEDQTDAPIEPMQLDGSLSRDIDSDPLVYAWTLTASPPSSTASMNNPQAAQPVLSIDVPGIYEVALVVFDGTEYSLPDVLTITASTMAPSCGGNSLERSPFNAMRVITDTLLLGAVPAVGGSLSVTAVNPPVSGLAQAYRVGPFLVYEPNPYFSGNDAFTIEIAEEGGATATCTVNVTVVVRNGPTSRIVGMHVVAGKIRIDGAGVPGQSYSVYCSRDGGTEWQEVGVGEANPLGRFSVSHQPSSTSAIYRAVFLPNP